MHCTAYDCTMPERSCILRQITTEVRVFGRYIKHGVVPTYLAKCQSGTCEQGNALRFGDNVERLTVVFDPEKDFRDQLVHEFRHEDVRLWRRFAFPKEVLVSVQASKAHHCNPQDTYEDKRMYTAFEVVVSKAGVVQMQVQYLETELVQRVLKDLTADFERITLSPLRPLGDAQ